MVTVWDPLVFVRVIVVRFAVVPLGGKKRIAGGGETYPPVARLEILCLTCINGSVIIGVITNLIVLGVGEEELHPSALTHGLHPGRP